MRETMPARASECLRIPALSRCLGLVSDHVDFHAIASAGNTGPSVQTRWNRAWDPAGSVVTSTTQPMQQPIAQPIRSYNETCAGIPLRRARAAAAVIIGVGPHI